MASVGGCVTRFWADQREPQGNAIDGQQRVTAVGMDETAWFDRSVEGNAQPDAQEAVAAQKINDLIAELFEWAKITKGPPVLEEKRGQKTDAEKWSGRAD